MLRIWGRLSSINVRKVVLCAQVLGLKFERIDAGLKQAFRSNPAVRALLPGITKEVEQGRLAASTAARRLLQAGDLEN